MLATFFQWTIHPGRETEFVAKWREGTALLLTEGSLGSALYRNQEGGFNALARWPDADTRDAAFKKVQDNQVFAQMRDCVAETIRRDDTEEVYNMWHSQ